MWWVVAAVWLLFILTVVFQPVYRIGDWWLDRREARRKAGKEAATTGPPHVHGAWCHPSADGCPDRPGA